MRRIFLRCVNLIGPTINYKFIMQNSSQAAAIQSNQITSQLANHLAVYLR